MKNYMGPIQAACLFVCSKYKEMNGNTIESYIVNLSRAMSMFKLQINVKLPQLSCIVVSAAQNGEFERGFGAFCVDCNYT